ncbi:MAG: hypothetical protein AAGJ87_05660 [Pseudomonadota bacterium]
MSDEKTAWSPDREQALRALIKATIREAGDLPPDAIPHRVREAIKDYATGDLDVDAYVKALLAETRDRK